MINDFISKSKNIVFLTGAGISTLSNIPDYRSKKGLYSNINTIPEEILSIECFQNDFDTFFDFVKNKMYYPNAKPNKIHNFIANLEKDHNVTIITQNIDSLHQKANSSNVIEFHGNLRTCYCPKCNKEYDIKKFFDKKKCCSNNLKPAFILYDEIVSTKTIGLAISAITKADLIIAIGTSLSVYPFVDLLEYINPSTKTVYINKKNESQYNFDLVIEDDFNNMF